MTHCTIGKDAIVDCKQVASGLYFPNGLVKARDGAVYVPSSASGGIAVFEPRPDRSLEQVATIYIDYGPDNLSQDADGTIFAAALPKAIPSLKAFDDPMNTFPPSTILRIRKVDGKYKWEKEIEDAKGEALGMSTVAVSDVKTGTLFTGSKSTIALPASLDDQNC